MATTNQREKLKEVAKDMGYQFVEVPRQWGIKDANGVLTLLGDDINAVHGQLMALKQELENESHQ